jgi:hypothetical protein
VSGVSALSAACVDALSACADSAGVDASDDETGELPHPASVADSIIAAARAAAFVNNFFIVLLHVLKIKIVDFTLTW